jgi:Stress responsive A/B Barrel Domain
MITRLTLVAAAILCCFGCSTMQTVNEESHIGKLRHVVLFKFKDSATPEQVRAIEDSFRALPSKVQEIAAFEWGRDVSTEGKTDGFTHCFMVGFKNAQGRDAYLPHPAHKKFVELLKPSLDKVLVVDYIARGASERMTPIQTKGKLRHVVLFEWKEGATQAQVETNENSFASLPGKIPQISAFEWGRDCSVEGLSNGFTHCFLVTFDDAAGRSAYLPHPAHKQFGKTMRPTFKRVLVIDYIAGQ